MQSATNNPFQDILQELAEIRETIKLIRIAPTPQIEIIDRLELQKRLGLSQPTVIRWTKQGKIPEMRLGNNIRYNWGAVVEALQKAA